ncbi:MAG: hypothetical protein A2203_15705, partial [Chromatiales bacterium RIFOXYA1_FULL_46_5]
MTVLDSVSSAVLQLLHKDLLVVDQSGVLLCATGVFSDYKIGRFLSDLFPAISLLESGDNALALCGPVQVSHVGPMVYQVIPLNEPQKGGYCLLFQQVSDHNVLQKKSEHMQQLLFQSEKMAVIGQLTTSVTHEINNPVGYVHSNLLTFSEYVDNLIKMIELLSDTETTESSEAIKHRFDYEYICEDIRNLLKESAFGLEQVISQIMSLKDLSHTDEGHFQLANIEAGILSSLTIVNNELKYKAVIHKEFAGLPLVECIPSQLNQVMLNLLVNAGHAISDHGEIYIRTGLQQNWVWVEVQDNGCGISDEHLS